MWCRAWLLRSPSLFPSSGSSICICPGRREALGCEPGTAGQAKPMSTPARRPSVHSVLGRAFAEANSSLTLPFFLFLSFFPPFDSTPLSRRSHPCCRAQERVRAVSFCTRRLSIPLCSAVAWRKEDSHLLAINGHFCETNVSQRCGSGGRKARRVFFAGHLWYEPFFDSYSSLSPRFSSQLFREPSLSSFRCCWVGIALNYVSLGNPRVEVGAPALCFLRS